MRSPEGRCVLRKDEGVGRGSRQGWFSLFLPDRGVRSQPVQAPRPEECVLEGHPRQGPGAGGALVFLASAHSQWPKV